MNDTELNNEFVNLIRKITTVKVDDAHLSDAITQYFYDIDLSDHIDQERVVDDVVDAVRYDIETQVEHEIESRLSYSEIEHRVEQAVMDVVSPEDIKKTIASEVSLFLTTDDGKKIVQDAIHNLLREVFK